MGYRYELHCHTGDVSKCGRVSPQRLAELYCAAGYTGVCVTNHFNLDTFDHLLPTKSWEEIVDFFLAAPKKVAEAAGGRLQVFAGMEIRFPQNTNDYLVYGITEDFLKGHPGLLDMDIKGFSALARKEGLLLFQAHPFRDGMTVVNPGLLDGIEVSNGHPRHDSRNDIAKGWAKKFNLLTLSGSDFHEEGDQARGGIETPAPIADGADLVRVLREEPELIYPDGVKVSEE